MSNLNPVLYGNRLFGQETYSANADPQTFNLSFSDSVSSADALADQMTKALADATTLLDAYAVMLTLVKTDTLTLADAKALMLTHPLSDSISSADAAVIHFTKALMDMQVSSDSIHFMTDKALSDSMTLAEAFMVSFGKVFMDTLILADSRALTVTKPLSEGPLPTPVLYGRNLFGVVTYSNTSNPNNPPMVLSDSIVFMLTKHVTDSLTLTDMQHSVLTKQLFEVVSTIDARILTTITKVFIDDILLQDWISIQLQKISIWTGQVSITPYNTLYGVNLYGRKVYSGIAGTPWIKIPIGQVGNGWTNFNEMRNA